MELDCDNKQQVAMGRPSALRTSAATARRSSTGRKTSTEERRPSAATVELRRRGGRPATATRRSVVEESQRGSRQDAVAWRPSAATTLWSSTDEKENQGEGAWLPWHRSQSAMGSIKEEGWRGFAKQHLKTKIVFFLLCEEEVEVEL
jgi:hypothetical protein